MIWDNSATLKTPKYDVKKCRCDLCGFRRAANGIVC